MNTSTTIQNILPALLLAQQAIVGAQKDAKNPFFNSTYSTLSSVIDACKKPLNDNGIILMQPIENGVVTTVLAHTSGETISDGGTPIVCGKPNDPQALGSAITYAKRYGLMALLCIPSEDDDGNAAVPEKPKESQPVSTLKMMCNIHNAEMNERISSKTGKPYFAHNLGNGSLCFGD